jgi:hypothetical protein
MVRPALLGFGGILCTVILIAAGWMLLYPERTDPKSLSYFLWKHGLHSMEVSDAAAAMIGDQNREDLILGKTEPELERRFGHLLSSSEIPTYLRHCYQEYGEESGQEVRFIARSDWMIIFSKNRAVRLVLIKSCY